MTSRTRVCIIGAGPSGLLNLYHLLRLDEVDEDIVCFEKQSTLGGQWNFDWRTGTDVHGELSHGSMYKDLWTNNPKEMIELSQYTHSEHFGRSMPSFLPREKIHDYLKGFSRRFLLDRFIRYNNVVRMVKYNQNDDVFSVSVTDLITDKTHEECFTHVVVANGIFSTPNKAEIPGIATYSGILMHAHDLKEFTPFKDKSVLVIGSGFSAVDTAIMSLKYGARQICISHKLRLRTVGWPETITERPLVANINYEMVCFEDGTTMNPDIIVLCTGYQCHFPFMDNNLRLRTKLSFYPDNLYKGILFTKGGNHKLFYSGVLNETLTFSYFNIQASYIRGLLKEEPVSRSQMARDMDVWKSKAACLNDFIAKSQFQTEYCVDLAKILGMDYNHYKIMSEIFCKNVENMDKDICSCRNHVFRSVFTGILAASPEKPWIDSKDARV